MLLDTHVWLWFVSGSDELSSDLKRRIESNPAAVLVSPISLWEILVLCRKKRLKLRVSPEKFVRRALELFPFKQAPLSHEIALRSELLAFKHEDPADRFLAATAQVYDVPLATRDKRLLQLPWLKCVIA